MSRCGSGDKKKMLAWHIWVHVSKPKYYKSRQTCNKTCDHHGWAGHWGFLNTDKRNPAYLWFLYRSLSAGYKFKNSPVKPYTMDVSKIYLSLKTVSLIVKLRDQKWIDYYFLGMLKEKNLLLLLGIS